MFLTMMSTVNILSIVFNVHSITKRLEENKPRFWWLSVGILWGFAVICIMFAVLTWVLYFRGEM